MDLKLQVMSTQRNKQLRLRLAASAKWYCQGSRSRPRVKNTTRVAAGEHGRSSPDHLSIRNIVS